MKCSFQSLLIRAVLTSFRSAAAGFVQGFQSLLIRAVLTSCLGPWHGFSFAGFNPFLSGLSLLRDLLDKLLAKAVSIPSYQGCPYFRLRRFLQWPRLVSIPSYQGCPYFKVRDLSPTIFRFNPFLSGLSLLRQFSGMSHAFRSVSIPSYQGCPYFLRSLYDAMEGCFNPFLLGLSLLRKPRS